jgi:hypothetical protein
MSACEKKKKQKISQEKQCERKEKLAQMFNSLSNIVVKSNNVAFQGRFVEITGENNVNSALMKLKDRLFTRLKMNGNEDALVQNDASELNSQLAEIESINTSVFSSTIGIKRVYAQSSLHDDLDMISKYLERN